MIGHGSRHDDLTKLNSHDHSNFLCLDLLDGRLLAIVDLPFDRPPSRTIRSIHGNGASCDLNGILSRRASGLPVSPSPADRSSDLQRVAPQERRSWPTLGDHQPEHIHHLHGGIRTGHADSVCPPDAASPPSLIEPLSCGNSLYSSVRKFSFNLPHRRPGPLGLGLLWIVFARFGFSIRHQHAIHESGHGHRILMALLDFILLAHNPRGHAVDFQGKSRGLDHHPTVAAAEPFDVIITG